MSLPSQFSSEDVEIAAQPKTPGSRAQGSDRAAKVREGGQEDRTDLSGGTAGQSPFHDEKPRYCSQGQPGSSPGLFLKGEQLVLT